MTLPTPGGITADDPEGDPPYPVHPNILSMVTTGEVSEEFLDFFYEGFLVYSEESNSVIITHKGRRWLEDYFKKGGTT